MPTSFQDQKAIYIGLAIIALLAGVLLILYIVRLLFGRRIRAPGARNRQRRLDVVDVFDLDRERQLVIVRRDNIEHLLLIGGPNDLLVEGTINRVEAALGRPENREARASATGWPQAPTPALPNNAAPSAQPPLAAESAKRAPDAPPPAAPAKPAGPAPALPPDLFAPPPAAKPAPPAAEPTAVAPPPPPPPAAGPRISGLPPRAASPRPPMPPFLARAQQRTAAPAPALKKDAPPPSAEAPVHAEPAQRPPAPSAPLPHEPVAQAPQQPSPPPAPPAPKPPEHAAEPASKLPAAPEALDALESLEAEMARLLGRPE
jgi:flagellar protein FliO/FliZ